MHVPCNQCIGCKLEKSRQWAIRCAHEASLHKHNCFITLTYNEEYLPKNGSLNLSHFQNFMKRLRDKYPQKIKFFHCGEYGNLNMRPHYHALLFNHDFSDKLLFKIHNDNRYYTSQNLDRLWPFGHNIIGDLTFASAAYVARYCLKKMTGHQFRDWYTRVDMTTGEMYQIKPEYATMSRRPGIGADWLKKYKTDVYPWDYVIQDGRKIPLPKYYDRQMEVDDPKSLKIIKMLRKQNARKRADNNTPERLQVRETLQKLKQAQIIRGLDNDT